MTAESAMRKIHKRVMDYTAAYARLVETVDTADPVTLRRIDEETANHNESFISDIEGIAVRWKKSENRHNKKRKKK